MELFTVVLFLGLFAQFVVAAPISWQNHGQEYNAGAELTEGVSMADQMPNACYPVPPVSMTLPPPIKTTKAQRTNYNSEDYVDPLSSELASSDEPEPEIITIS